MSSMSVTSKGQVTIPKDIRQKLGIHSGSRVIWRVSGDHAELIVERPPAGPPSEGFGLLKSSRKSVPADFDVAALVDEK